MANKQKKAIEEPSGEKLIEASSHIWYEITMLEAMCKGLMSGVTQNGPLHNAMLESFAIHFRALYDFIYLDKSKFVDDVLAIHYFSDQERWKNDRPEATATLKTVRERVNKEIAHITLVRLDKAVAGQAWSFVAIARELIDVFRQSFTNKVPRELLSKKWDAIQTDQPPSDDDGEVETRQPRTIGMTSDSTTSYIVDDSSPFIYPRKPVSDGTNEPGDK